jgi:hypothetical protein
MKNVSFYLKKKHKNIAFFSIGGGREKLFLFQQLTFKERISFFFSSLFSSKPMNLLLKLRKIKTL